MISRDQERIRTILSATVTSICKNGLNFNQEVHIDALIAVTVDRNEVFLVSVNETIGRSLPETLSAVAKHELCGETTVAKVAPQSNAMELLPDKIHPRHHGSDAYDSIDKQHVKKNLSTLGPALKKRHYKPTDDLFPVSDISRGYCESGNSDSVQPNGINQTLSSVGTDISHADRNELSQVNDHLNKKKGFHNKCANSSRSFDDEYASSDNGDDSVIIVKQEPAERVLDFDDSESVSPRLAGNALDDISALSSAVQKSDCGDKRPLDVTDVPLTVTPEGYSHLVHSGSASTSGTLSGCGLNNWDIENLQQSVFDSSSSSSKKNFSNMRRCRSILAPYQVSRLQKAFSQSQYVSSELRAQLAEELHLSENVIGIWFQNRRYNFKKLLRKFNQT